MLHLRQLFKLPYYELNFTTVKVLDRTKFAILFIVLVLVFMVSIPCNGGLGCYSGDLANPYEQFCPARPMYVIFQQLLTWEPWSTGVHPLGLTVLGFFFVLSFVVRKFWCRVCPIGAINSFFNKYALLTLQKDGSKCTKCRICLRACPMDIEEIYEEKGKTNISSKECIHCYRCVELCPEEGCLSVAFLEKTIVSSKSPYIKKDSKKQLFNSESKDLLKKNKSMNNPLSQTQTRSEKQDQGPGPGGSVR
jgi:formate hydrogenlyase subunit 6/NADH:ubiquinone oxidoreductase subunit I